ncbi:oxygen-regulated protein 1 [Petromyzon marinus]|uniref:oxygen-regulated protein 1 n=1 Tax=Petromyzon marinus TaxID=7757 RepID=UPI003F71F8FB
MTTPTRTPVPPAGPRTGDGAVPGLVRGTGPDTTAAASDAGGGEAGRRARRSAAKRVYFYKSGDPQFGALPLVVSERSFRTFESLLDELSRRVPLPMGVRRVTTPRGRHVVNQLNELHDGSAYMCSDHHRRQPPAPPPHPALHPPNRRPAAGVGNVNDNDDDDWHYHHDRHDYHQEHHDHNQHDHHQQHQRHHHGRDDLQETQRGGGGGGGWRPVVQPPREPRRSGSHIKRLTLFRNGTVGSQRALLLSRQSAPNLEAVLAYFSEILQCPVRQLYTRNGSKVESLEGLFNGPSSLVAAGSEPFRAVAYDGMTSRHKLPGLAKVARGPEPSAKPGESTSHLCRCHRQGQSRGHRFNVFLRHGS